MSNVYTEAQHPPLSVVYDRLLAAAAPAPSPLQGQNFTETRSNGPLTITQNWEAEQNKQSQGG